MFDGESLKNKGEPSKCLDRNKNAVKSKIVLVYKLSMDLVNLFDELKQVLSR